MSPRPVYWKPRYATRRMRERAYAKQDLARERAVARAPHAPGPWSRFLAWFRR